MNFRLLGFLPLFLLLSCQPSPSGEHIMTTTFAHYDLTRKLVLNTQLDVVFPVTSGQSVHDWNPSAQDIQQFYDAKLIIHNGLDLEPWIEPLLDQEEIEATWLDVSFHVELLGDHDHHDHDSERLSISPSETTASDPHYWLDPFNAQLMVEAIAEQLQTLFPEDAATIALNQTELMEDLTNLENSFTNLLSQNHHDEELPELPLVSLVYGGHNAFGYWTQYGMAFETPYQGFSSSTNPTAQQINDLTLHYEGQTNKILYASRLEGLAIAEALQSQIEGLRLLYLSTLENVTSEELKTVSYVSLMEDNLVALAEGLHHD